MEYSQCGVAPNSRLQDGSFDPSFVISHRFDVSEFKELYAAFDAKEAGIMKVRLLFWVPVMCLQPRTRQTFVKTKFSSPPTPGFPELSSVKAVTAV